MRQESMVIGAPAAASDTNCVAGETGYQWKRAFDIVVSGILVILFLLPATLIFLALLFQEGPVIFRQERIGRGGRPFNIFKFRSMDDQGNVTVLGEFLRPTHLDELLQLLQVLFGQMSLVGPRPHTPEDVDKLEKINPLHRKLLEWKPGLISPVCLKGRWQDLHANDPAFDPTEVNLKFFTRETLMADIKLIPMAIRVVLTGAP